jgi:hypothetical protein
MATPSTEGSTKRYTSTNKKASVDFNNPFSVSIEERTTSNSLDGEDPPLTNECGFSFVQAFVVNYGRQQQEGAEDRDPTNENERMVWIENMDKVFKMDYSDSATPARRIYEVKIEIGDDGNVKRAQLQKKPIEGEEDYREDPTEDTLESGFVFIPVCETINENITKLWLRDNIHWGNVAGGSCQPWVPKFINSGTAEAPSWSYLFNFGTVNGTIPYNYYSENAISAQIANGDVEGFIILNVSTSGNRVVDVEYTIETSPAQGDDVDPIQVGAAPALLQINVGSVCGCGTFCIIYGGNITAEMYCAFTETDGNFTNGRENFKRWYKYKTY